MSRVKYTNEDLIRIFCEEKINLISNLEVFEPLFDHYKNSFTEDEKKRLWVGIYSQVLQNNPIESVKKVHKYLFPGSKLIEDLCEIQDDLDPLGQDIRDFIVDTYSGEKLMNLFNVLLKHIEYIPNFDHLAYLIIDNLYNYDKDEMIFEVLSKCPNPKMVLKITSQESENPDNMVEYLITRNAKKFSETFSLDEVLDMLKTRRIEAEYLSMAYPDSKRKIIKYSLSTDLSKDLTRSLLDFYENETSEFDQLRKEFSVLKAHLETMPDGKLYLETRREFYRRQGKEVPEFIS